MKIIKKISSIFIALSLMLTVVGFASAAPVSEENLKTFLMQFPLGQPDQYDSNNMPTLKQYPQVLNFLSELLLDLKVDEQDLDVHDPNSIATRIFNCRIKKDFLESKSRYMNMGIASMIVSQFAGYKFFSGYEISNDKSLYLPFHHCAFCRIIDKNGKEESRFYWIDKKECKEEVKQMMDGNFDIKQHPYFSKNINNDDNDLLFIKHVQDSIIKYCGDIDSFFDDDELAKKFLITMVLAITDDTKEPMTSQKIVPMISSDKTEAIKQYKDIGRKIVTKTLEHKGLQEGKDYEVVYDKEIGYIKELKNLKKESQSSSSDASKDNSAQAELMKNVFIVACILLAIIVVGAIVVVIFALVKRK